jgi:hypothetical protein
LFTAIDGEDDTVPVPKIIKQLTLDAIGLAVLGKENYIERI